MAIVEEDFTVAVSFVRPGDPRDHNAVGEGHYRESWHNSAGVLHRPGAPAVTIRHIETGEVHGREWWWDGELHREDGPAQILIESDRVQETWMRSGLVHREGGPAYSITTRGPSPVVMTEHWRINGEYHRLDGPAVILRSAHSGLVFSERWALNGKTHREDGPAVIERDESTGIATEEEWRIDGKLHRADGPAVVVRDGQSGLVTEREFYLRGQKVDASAISPTSPDPAR